MLRRIPKSGTVCVEVTARSIYGAAAVGLAFDSGYRRHDNVGAVTIGDGHTRCRVMVTRYASHLVVEALSGYKNGTVRQRGKLKRIYWPTPATNGCGNVVNLLVRLPHPWKLQP